MNLDIPLEKHLELLRSNMYIDDLHDSGHATCVPRHVSIMSWVKWQYIDLIINHNDALIAHSNRSD